MGLVTIVPHGASGAGRFGNRFYGNKVKFNKNVWLHGGRWLNDLASDSNCSYAARAYLASNRSTLGTGVSGTVALGTTKKWFPFGFTNPIFIPANTEVWIGVYFSNGSNMSIPFQTPGNPHDHSSGDITATTIAGGNTNGDACPTDTFNPVDNSGTEPTYEYAIALTVSDTPFIGTDPYHGQARTLSMGTTIGTRVSFDRTIAVEGLSFFTPRSDGVNTFPRPRLYRATNGLLVASGSGATRFTNLSGWHNVVPFDGSPAILEAGVQYDICFYIQDSNTTYMYPGEYGVTTPHNHTITFGGQTYTLTCHSTAFSTGDTAPTLQTPNNVISLGISIVAGGNTHQMML